MTRQETWALVTNGVHARILRGLDDAEGAGPAELVAKTRSAHLRAAIADGTGQRLAAPGGRRDPVLWDMEDFARETLATLEGHLQAGRLTRLAILARPRMLEVLRREMPASLRGAVILERDLDLVALPAAELRRRVLATIAAARPG